MCRISGIVNYPQHSIILMLEVQKNGGPDLSRFVTTDNVSIGHNLLSVIGYQPQPLESERYTMTFNGTWYDYRSFYNYSTSDSTSLLDHFGRRGLKALEDINGMFAIGLHDKIDKKIHLIVDRFCQKQLYYFHQGDKFAFASNPAALYHLIPKKEINKEALNSYWLLGSVMGEDSILKGIKKVCAGEIVTFDLESTNVERKRWYTPKFRDEPIEELVIDAIDQVKIADVPIHIFLSGGIDSTLVASRFANNEAIHLDSPELIYAQQVAEKYNINLKVVKPNDIQIEKNLTDYCTFSGEPSMSALIPYITAKEVSKFGRVAITANGADELFFGYDRTSDECSDKQQKHIFRMSLNSEFLADAYDFAQSGDNRVSWGRLLELQTYVQYDLNKTLDFSSMAHGVEMRSPFLDHRLVESALSIPEQIHRKRGNKTILKDILAKYGFDKQFLDRPKVGFSLHKKPLDLDKHIRTAWNWVKSNDFLQCDEGKLTGRDKAYLEMSALGFYYWYKTYFK